MGADADGDFVVAWWSATQDGDVGGVFARRFSSGGASLAGEFQVNSHTLANQQAPAVAVDANGRFVVAWASSTQDGSNYGIFARSFSSTGVPLASEFQVNSYTSGPQFQPAVAASGGGFVVVWHSDQDGEDDLYQPSPGVFARRVSSLGAPLGSQFQVNTYTTGSQVKPAVSADAGGDFVVAWASNQDGGSYGVFAQRFPVPIPLDIDGNGAAEPLTDGLLSLRYLFGFRGPTLATGAVDLVGCSRCDAASIEAYLAGLT